MILFINISKFLLPSDFIGCLLDSIIFKWVLEHGHSVNVWKQYNGICFFNCNLSRKNIRIWDSVFVSSHWRWKREVAERNLYALCSLLLHDFL